MNEWGGKEGGERERDAMQEVEHLLSGPLQKVNPLHSGELGDGKTEESWVLSHHVQQNILESLTTDPWADGVDENSPLFDLFHSRAHHWKPFITQATNILICHLCSLVQFLGRNLSHRLAIIIIFFSETNVPTLPGFFSLSLLSRHFGTLCVSNKHLSVLCSDGDSSLTQRALDFRLFHCLKHT